jgi:hypothetical protein
MPDKEFTRAEIEAFFLEVAKRVALPEESHQVISVQRIFEIEQPTWLLVDRIAWSAKGGVKFSKITSIITIKDGDFWICKREEMPS